MADGTMLFAAKRALVERLDARMAEVVVTYEPPRNATDIQTLNGVYDAVWFDPDADIVLTVPHLSGQYSVTNPVHLDETASFKVIVQTLRREGSQEDVDMRASEMLHDVVAVMATEPVLDDVTGVQSFWFLPRSASVTGGFLPASDGHGCRIELDVEAFSRLTLT